MSLKQKTISGTKWTSIDKIIVTVFAIVKLSVLARYLDKADFGLMAIVSVILGFMNMFVSLGLNVAIIHKQNISKNEYSSLYFMNIFMSILIMMLVMISSSFIANFYTEPRLRDLVIIMSLTIIISAIGKQYQTIKQKELEFKFISIVSIVAAIISCISSIYLAINGYGVYSLVYSSLIGVFFSNIVYFSEGILKKGFTFHFRLKEIKPFFKIGIYQVGGQIINYFNRDLDTLLIGKLLGSEVLGGYSLAKQLVLRPTSIINPIFTTVASPAFAKIQNDKKQFKLAYLKLLNIISSVNFIAYFLLCLLAYPVVIILYGTDFTNIVIIVQILCFYMYVRSLGNPIGSLVVATGKTHLEFYWNLLSLFFLPLFIYLGSLYSITAICIALCLYMAVSIYPAFRLMVKPILKIDFQLYMKTIVKLNFTHFTKLLKR